MPSLAGTLAPSDAVSLEEKVRFLCSPAAYGGGPARVRGIETHMSWVFLAGREAYKLKKPMKTPLLDFGTPEARRADCQEEVRLNRRLAPDVYLGVSALAFDPDTGFRIDGPGEAVDWLVRMRRLPSGIMMERVIARGALTPGLVERLGDRLAGFYAGLPPADITPGAYLERFRAQHAFNMGVLTRFRSLLDRTLLDEAARAVETFLDHDADLLGDRALRGRIVEGHGDLRPEHVCLSEPPVVIDCLEFNRFLRLVDPFEEVAFLGLECARLGVGWVGKVLGRQMETLLGESPGERIKAFHAALRALLRVQLTLAHLDEPAPRTPRRWPRLARAYLGLAHEAARALAIRSS